MHLLFFEIYKRSLYRTDSVAFSKNATHYGQSSGFPQYNLATSPFPPPGDVLERLCEFNPRKPSPHQESSPFSTTRGCAGAALWVWSQETFTQSRELPFFHHKGMCWSGSVSLIPGNLHPIKRSPLFPPQGDVLERLCEFDPRKPSPVLIPII